MGCMQTCVLNMMGPYSAKDFEKFTSYFTPRLPVAQLMNDGIIKLEGTTGFFNPNSLFDLSWLQGKMTLEEYRQAIDYINRCAFQPFIGVPLTTLMNATEREKYEESSVQGGFAAIEEVNKRYPAVHFTYEVSFPEMEKKTIQIPGETFNQSTKVILYIKLD